VLYGSRRDAADRTTPGRGAMTKHKTGTREEWLTERLELLKEEKELTRRSDDLAIVYLAERFIPLVFIELQ
jgi:predicted dithiol-disulfide oxidoreductase (DUF899 family)